MKKWVIEVDKNKITCEVTRTYLRTLQIHLCYNGIDYKVTFMTNKEYQSAKVGNWESVYIEISGSGSIERGGCVFQEQSL